MMNQFRFVSNKSWGEKREICYDLCTPWYPCTTRSDNNSRIFILLWSSCIIGLIVSILYGVVGFQKQLYFSARTSAVSQTIEESRGDFRRSMKNCIRSWGIVLQMTIKKVLSAYDRIRIELCLIYFLNSKIQIQTFEFA